MTPTPEKESEKMKPIAWLCEFVREDDSIDRQVVMEDPEGTRWADMPDGEGVSPFKVTPLYASPSVPARVEEAQTGWKLVPVEPTEEMWTAGRDPIMYRDVGYKVPESMEAPPWRINPTTGAVEKDKSKGTTAVHVWRAMIAASPSPRVEAKAAEPSPSDTAIHGSGEKGSEGTAHAAALQNSSQENGNG